MTRTSFARPLQVPARALVFVAVFGSVLSVLTFVSPQVESIGRGLRTTLPAGAIAALAIAVLAPGALLRAARRFRTTLLFGALFVFQAGARFAFADDALNSLQRYVLGPACVLMLVCIVGALSELGQPVVERFRFWLLVLWGASLGAGLPSLWESSGIARLRMARDTAVEVNGALARDGVGEYTVYTAFAVSLPLLVLAAKGRTGAQRWIGVVAVALGSVTVAVSTFTMAAALLVAAGAGIVLTGAWLAGGARRLFAGAALAAALLLAPAVATWVGGTEQTAMVFDKARRLGVGVSTYGLERGEETMRGAWFLEEMAAFAEEPFLGYVPGITGGLDNGHSSLSNSLVLFGLFGAATWLLAILSLARDSVRFAPAGATRVSYTMAWGLLAAAGVLNPSWHSPAILGALIAFGIGTRVSPPAIERSAASHHR